MEKVSIVIPAHNEEFFISGLLASLERHIKNTPYQVIVVNNGSTDETETIAVRHNCQVITTDAKVSPSEARNIGAKQCTSELLVFLDADVIITPSWGRQISVLSEEFERDKNFITGNTYLVSQCPSKIELFWFEPLRKTPKSYINGGNLILNKCLFNLLEGFNEQLETGEDVDFCIRAKAAGANLVLDSELLVHHEGFPKSSKNFIKRERWHGKGDLVSLHHFLKSKVAIASLIFMALHFFSVLSLVMQNYTFAISSLLLVIALCCLSSYRSFHSQRSLKQFFAGSLIYYLYYLGRSLSLYDRIREYLDLRRNCKQRKQTPNEST